MKELSARAAYWFGESMTWMDAHWDEETGLFRTVDGSDHSVRNSIWYAFGLLYQGKEEKAYQTIHAVLQYQYDTPGTVYHGTFKRTPKEPDPPAHAKEWKDYDPNWREFICTVFLIMMREFELPETLKDKLWQSIDLATTGAYERNVSPAYTNISLMSAFLLDHAGKALGQARWRERAESLAQEIVRLYSENENFWEYNSPTYYGTDLYALTLWRDYGLTDTFRKPGRQMEAGLWRDIAQFYHADLRNLCGPYDRSYGMDLTKYLGLVGLYIALAVEPERAPLPDPKKPFGHDHDFMFAPLTYLLGTEIPGEALPHLQHFQGERQLERVIEPGRIATAYLSPKVMIGAETIHPSRLPNGHFHPLTLHWQVGTEIAWLRLLCDETVAVSVKGWTITLSCPGARNLRFEVSLPDLDAADINPGRWVFPGLEISLLEYEVNLAQEEHLWLQLEVPEGELILNVAEKST
ncbi:MAG: hypothetical protein KC422_00435 [Trueperaceae bacterium]|nr:hypothetical protein [Trueperaceae bacterium]